MPGRKLKLGLPEIAATIDALHAKEADGWRKNRLLAVKLAARGEYTAAEVGDLCGVSRGRVFEWVKQVRTGGLGQLLSREKPGPKPCATGGLDAAVAVGFRAKLEAGEFSSAVAARRWLSEEHGQEHSYWKVWSWLKKLGGVLLVPRPSHLKKDPEAAGAFREGLAQKLCDLDIPAGSRVKLWMMDEARFGLHTELRKLWALKGQRPVVSKQIKYEWDYLFGSLEVIGGEAHFCHIPGVSLEWDRAYLDDLVATDPGAVHVLIRDGAGFHLRDGDPRLPEGVRIVDLPAYSPELNPCEQFWDMVKDAIGNRVFETIEALREAMLPILRRHFEDAKAVLSLIGRPWIAQQANSSRKNRKSCYLPNLV